jgi:hypothetical protein
MKTIIAIIVVFFTFSLSAYARIGETLEQCARRYGPSVGYNETTKTHRFVKGGFELQIGFLEGKAAIMYVMKEARDVINRRVPLSDHEKELLVQANGAGASWQNPKELVSVAERWLSDSGDRFAEYDQIHNVLWIVTKPWADKEKAATQAQEIKNLEGF